MEIAFVRAAAVVLLPDFLRDVFQHLVLPVQHLAFQGQGHLFDAGRADIFGFHQRQSGRDIDKEKAAGLTLVKSENIRTPGIKEVPLTLECRVLYVQDQVLENIPEEIRKQYYSHGTDSGDFHTAYIAQIVDAYIIRED